MESRFPTRQRPARALPPEVETLVQEQLARLENVRLQHGAQATTQSQWVALPDILVGSDFIARALMGTRAVMDRLDAVGNPADLDHLRQRIEAISGTREEVASALRRVRQE